VFMLLILFLECTVGFPAKTGLQIGRLDILETNCVNLI